MDGLLSDIAHWSWERVTSDGKRGDLMSAHPFAAMAKTLDLGAARIGCGLMWLSGPAEPLEMA